MLRCGRQGCSTRRLRSGSTGSPAWRSGNDSFGHGEGDRAIREARVGGDEFCILLTGGGAADEPIARLHHRVDRRNGSPDARYALAFSLGRAVFDPAQPRALEELVDKADAAMYAEKVRRRSSRSG